MQPQFKVCKMTSAGTMVLPAGRLSYPNLFVARAMPGEPEDKAKFSTSVMLPPDADLSLAVKWVNDTATEKWLSNVGKMKKPFLKHAEHIEDQELAAAFPVLIRLASAKQPSVVFANGEPCKTDDEVYPGRWARVSARIFAWEHKTGGRGISFGLSNVQLLDHDERIGGGRAKVEDEFEFIPDTESGGGDPDSIFK